MKNVWLINHYGNTMYENQGGRHYWFAKELVNRGYNVTIICSNQFHEKNEEISIEKGLYKIDHKDGIRFIFIKSVSSQGNGGKRVLNMLSFYRNVMKSYWNWIDDNATRPNYIIGSSVHPLSMVAGIKMSKKLGIPPISEVRDLWPEAIFSFNKAKENSFMGKMLVKGEKWIYENSKAIIFTKEGDVDYIKEQKWDTASGGKINLEKCFYINNGVDLDFFDAEATNNALIDEDLDNDKFKVVYAGALRPVNNVSTLVEAATYLKDYKDIQILIYGQGIEFEKLQTLINEQNLTNVKLKGFVNKRNIPYILKKSSLNILNYSQSQYNWSRGNSSNKLFEYMAAGKPIISNVKMGYCLLEKYDCGYITQDNTAKALAEEILKVYSLNENEYTRFSENARKAAADFDFGVLTSKLEDVLKYVSKR
ncbi:glycosyltransferase family 4 protein [Caryophanon tenue]|uniref:Glycosyltransferase WbuB n=1 Tax=Caryophanon tenue TaxID=33978 RepID=A0A1C0Y8G8_9BACL|nr:glycosyltransferase family 4 protein [Caryophanon tenue]OCS83423.1 glycosyltransferase WbuB [Caryophanon tenue]